MKIEKFTNDDFAKAAPLAAGAWGDFYATNGSGLSMQWQSISFAITIAIPRLP